MAKATTPPGCLASADIKSLVKSADPGRFAVLSVDLAIYLLRWTSGEVMLTVAGPDGRAMRFPSAHAASRYVAKKGYRGPLELVHHSAYAEMSDDKISAGARSEMVGRFRLGLALDD